MSDKTDREILSDRYLTGVGIEIGAGLNPTCPANASEIVFVDKRDRHQLAEHLGADPGYDPLTLWRAWERYPDGVDFLAAHHVIEHCADPIRVLAKEWLPLVKPGGLLYLSLPSPKNCFEELRFETPINHILDDHYFSRGDLAYESKEHIYSFILQLTAANPRHFWYADDTQKFAKQALLQALADRQDLHWHTYALEVAVQTIEAAFYLAGMNLEWLHREETDNELHLICRRTAGRPPLPEFLAAYRERLAQAARSITRPG